MSFWGEPGWRNVFKVCAAYVIVVWLITYPVNIICPILHVADRAIIQVTSFLVIGFPFAFIFIRAYKITPKCLNRTKQAPFPRYTILVFPELGVIEYGKN
jgi:adenylate cyclase